MAYDIVTLGLRKLLEEDSQGKIHNPLILSRCAGTRAEVVGEEHLNLISIRGPTLRRVRLGSMPGVEYKDRVAVLDIVAAGQTTDALQYV